MFRLSSTNFDYARVQYTSHCIRFRLYCTERKETINRPSTTFLFLFYISCTIAQNRNAMASGVVFTQDSVVCGRHFIMFMSMVYSYNKIYNPQHSHQTRVWLKDCSRHSMPKVQSSPESHFALCKVVSLQVHDLQFSDAATAS